MSQVIDMNHRPPFTVIPVPASWAPLLQRATEPQAAPAATEVITDRAAIEALFEADCDAEGRDHG